MYWVFIYVLKYFYWPQRSCGQGNVFTGVCLSTVGVGGEGVCLSACWDTRPPRPGRPPQPGRPPRTRQTPPDQADPPPLGPGRHPPDQAPTPPGLGTHNPHPPDQADPPRKQTAAYGLRAAGMHPTGMHSCFS